MRNTTNDILLSLLCGLALLVGTLAGYRLLAGQIPDDWLLSDIFPSADPLGRMAFARFLLFGLVVALLAPLLAWPLARHATRRDVSVTLPGAACAAVLFLLLEQARGVRPFPPWLDPACAVVLFAALPLAFLFWRRPR